MTLGIAGLFLFGVIGGEDDRQQITFFGNRYDGSWNANIASGLDDAAREFGFELTDVAPVIDPVSQFRELAESGPDVIVSDSFPHLQDPSVVTDFPDVRFGLVGVSTDADNVSSATFADEEGGYLAGVAAALKSDTGVVGFIGGAPIQAIEEFRAGFEAGVTEVDPDTTILATYVNQFGEDVPGFGAPAIAAERARALYQRGADVVFHAAGHSGFGLFDVVVEESEAAGRHLWTIGVDNDQWFDVEVDQREHMLTSIIKRGDVAAFELVRAMLESDDRTNLELGAVDDVWDYSEQGDGLTSEMIAVLDRVLDEIRSGRVEVPIVPTGPVLLLSRDGNEIDGPEDIEDEFSMSGVDGLDGPIEPGTIEITALGTPLTLSFDDRWQAPRNAPGDTVFAGLGPDYDGDVTFLRPHLLTDPTRPGDAVGATEAWPLDDIEGWLDNLVDGIVTAGPERVQIGGREAVYFEAEVTDRDVCGNFDYCAGFLVNTIDEQGNVSGWAFQPGVHHQVWRVDQGDEPPLVIIVTTPSYDRGFQDQATTLLDTLVMGEPAPHPVPYEDAGIDL